MKSRKYKSGSRWAFWRWTEVDSEYITRLFLVKTPWFCVCLHWLNKPDPEPYLHDHPVTFLSIILRGWYEERKLAVVPFRIWYKKQNRWFNFVRADDAHTICKVSPGGALTLCFMGPKKRDWGFHDVAVVDDKLATRNGAWTYWQTYHHVQRAERARTAP